MIDDLSPFLLGGWPGWPLAAACLAAPCAIALLTWFASLVQRDLSLVDRVWSLCIVGAGAMGWLLWSEPGPRTAWALGLAGAWALRLSIYLTWRNWGRPEDRRYQALRARNGPNYAVVSLVTVFLLQAVLAWVIAAPLLAAVVSPRPLGLLDGLGLALAAAGLACEAVADAQMARFKAAPANYGRVMDRGLWRYSRHPNYFGECCVWWGLGLVALSAGAAWALVSPLLITWLLLKVSGVSLLEQDLRDRHPAYRDYIACTPAFVPGRPRRPLPHGPA